MHIKYCAHWQQVSTYRPMALSAQPGMRRLEYSLLLLLLLLLVLFVLLLDRMLTQQTTHPQIMPNVWSKHKSAHNALKCEEQAITEPCKNKQNTSLLKQTTKPPLSTKLLTISGTGSWRKKELGTQ